MSEVTPAVTRASARTPNGSAVAMSPAGMAKLQRMKDEIEREEAEAAAAEEAAAEAARIAFTAAQLTPVADGLEKGRSASFAADGALDRNLVSVMSDGYPSAGQAEEMAAILTKNFVGVRMLAEAEHAGDVKNTLKECGLTTTSTAAKRIFNAARTIYPQGPGSETSNDDSDGGTLSVRQALALGPATAKRNPAARTRSRSPRASRAVLQSAGAEKPPPHQPVKWSEGFDLTPPPEEAAPAGLVVYGAVGSVVTAKCSPAEIEELYKRVAPTQLKQFGFTAGSSAVENVACVESALSTILTAVLDMGPSGDGLQAAAAALAKMLAAAAAKAAPGGSPDPRPDSTMEQNFASLFLAQSLAAPAKDLATQTGEERAARVAGNPESSARLEQLRGLSSSTARGPGAPAALLKAVTSAAADDVLLAELIHTVKLPSASSAAVGSNPSCLDPRARHAGVAAATGIVQDMAVRALADVARSMVSMTPDTAIKFAKMVWFGTLLKNEPDIFKVDTLISEKKVHLLFPLFAYSYAASHQHDPSAPRTLATVSLLHEGLQLPAAIKPYFAELNATWDSFQHGAELPSCAAVLLVAERTSPAAMVYTARPDADASNKAAAAELKASKAAQAAVQATLDSQAKELKELKASIKGIRATQPTSVPQQGGKGAGRGGGAPQTPPAPTVP